MKALLKHKSTRKNFLIIIGLVLILVIILRIFVFPNDDFEITKYISSILDKIFISLLISLFLALFLFYIEIPDDEKKLEIIESSRLKEEFLKSYSQTDYWYFSGGTGRYMRYETIKRLSSISNNKNEHMNIQMLLINPLNEEICQKYATFRKSFELDETRNWTKEYVRNQILATIISTILFKNKNQLLDISIYLKNNFSMFRIDFNKKNCIITKEAKNEPAMIVPEKSFLYRTYKQEIFQGIEQSEHINTSYSVDEFDFGSVDLNIIKSLCKKFELPTTLTEQDFKQIQIFINTNDKFYG